MDKSHYAFDFVMFALGIISLAEVIRRHDSLPLGVTIFLGVFILLVFAIRIYVLIRD